MILFANSGLRNAPPAHTRDLSRRLVAYLLESFRAEPEVPSKPLSPASPPGLRHAKGQTDDGRSL